MKVKISPFHYTQLLYGCICLTVVILFSFAMVGFGQSGSDINVRVFIDNSDTLLIDDVAGLSDHLWSLRDSDKLNFGYTATPVWLKISSDSFPGNQNVIDLNFPQLDYVDLYIVDKMTLLVSDHQISGDRRPPKSKSIQSEKILFSIQKPATDFWAYVRIQTDGSNQAPILITSIEEYVAKFDFITSLLHFFLGFSLFASILYGMSLFVYQDVAYLYYIILNVSISALLLFHYRIINAYTDIFSIYAQHIGIVLSIMGAFYSAIKLVHINFKRWGFGKFNKQLEISSSCALLIIISFLGLEYQTSLVVVFVFLGVIAPYIMYMLISFVRNNWESKFLKLGLSIGAAWAIFLSGASAQILGEAGLILDTSFVNHGFLFGSLGIVLSMGLILSSNLQLENEQKLQAEKELALTNQRLYQSDKLAVISTMSSGLIHEIKNPLNWSKASMTIALDEVDDKSELKELVEDSLEGLNQIENIVQGLNWYAKSKTFALKPNVNLRDIIERTLNLAKYQCEGLVVENDVSPKLEVYGSENHLAQVIINILTNSIKAIKKVEGPHVGKIQITAGQVEGMTSNGKKQVFISWVDNGVGVDKDKIDKLFDPFFTTDDQQEGVGLGMSIAKQIIDKHEGKMEIISEKNEWTRINLYLNQS